MFFERRQGNNVINETNKGCHQKFIFKFYFDHPCNEINVTSSGSHFYVSMYIAYFRFYARRGILKTLQKRLLLQGLLIVFRKYLNKGK